jgi:hypothetical protein
VLSEIVLDIRLVYQIYFYDKASTTLASLLWLHTQSRAENQWLILGRRGDSSKICPMSAWRQKADIAVSTQRPKYSPYSPFHSGDIQAKGKQRLSSECVLRSIKMWVWSFSQPWRSSVSMRRLKGVRVLAVPRQHLHPPRRNLREAHTLHLRVSVVGLVRLRALQLML